MDWAICHSGGRAYGDVNRNAPQHELIDGPRGGDQARGEMNNVRNRVNSSATFPSQFLSISSKVLRCSLFNISTAITSPFLDNRYYNLSNGRRCYQGNMPRKFLNIFYHDGFRLVPSCANSLPLLMRVQASGPRKGPSTRVPSMTR